MKMVVALFVGEGPVGGNRVAGDPMAAAVGHVEERLVGGEAEPVGKQEARVDDGVGSRGGDEVDLARFTEELARIRAGYGDGVRDLSGQQQAISNARRRPRT